MSKKFTAAIAAAVALALVPVPATATGGNDAVVRTDKGLVAGTVNSTNRYFGNIPFAAAPVGANRWRDPQPASAWQGVRDATKSSPVCAQGPFLGAPGSENEDCLYLDVTTPAGPGRSRPVMVWVHGGAFLSGAASLYDARALSARTGSVVVTINYRLGVFGFFGHPGLPGSGAFGLADQQAALKWVRRNIHAFGGDAGNVTLFGESAGGLSVCAQLTSPRAAGLFDKAIIQSGACGITASLAAEPVTLWRPRAEVEKTGQGLLNCPDVACLRAKTTAELLPAHGQFSTPAFHTAVLPTDPLAAQRAGRVHRVPVLVGSTHDEARFFLALSNPQPIPEESYRSALAGTFGEARADQVMAHYPANGDGDARDQLADALTDASWACTTHDTRQQLGRVTKVHGYEFADPAAPLIFPNLPPFPGGYRAYHASELLMLFGFDIPLSPAQQQVSAYMMDAWGRFARTGEPGWRSAVQSLAPGAIGATDFATDHQCGFWSSIL